MSKPRLHLATPCYGGMAHALYLRSLLALRAACAAAEIPLEIDLSGGEALIGRARAAIMAKFLAGAASHLLFVDADIGFEPQAALRLLGSGRDVVGGAYPRKGRDAGFEVGAPLGPATPDGFQPVSFVGGGFLLVSRTAAQRMAAAHPRLRASLGDLRGAAAGQVAMVFDSFVEPETGLYLADHQAFCRRWRDLGGEVWADLQARLVHAGEIEYAGPRPPPSHADLPA